MALQSRKQLIIYDAWCYIVNPKIIIYIEGPTPQHQLTWIGLARVLKLYTYVKHRELRTLASVVLFLCN